MKNARDTVVMDRMLSRTTTLTPMANTTTAEAISFQPTSPSGVHLTEAKVEAGAVYEEETVHKGLTVREKLDGWLDNVVKASGSEPAFLIVLVALLVWAFLGIRFGGDEDWQVIISDVQAIFGYVYDSLLMRQQLNAYKRYLAVATELKSRALHVQRMFQDVKRQAIQGALSRDEFENLKITTEHATELPPENLIGRITTVSANVMGHLITCIVFWIGIIVWLALGPYCGWSVMWQLYINSATSAMMVLIFAFLANIHERHYKTFEISLGALNEVDQLLEQKLQLLTGKSSLSHQEIITGVAPPKKYSRFQRIIFYYANIVGALVGIALLVIVLVIWACIGPALHFDSNWWLIIGTYAGLVGMQDSFVLRNVQHEFDLHIDAAFEAVNLQDADTFENTLGFPLPQTDAEDPKHTSLTVRLSMRMGAFCSHQYMVLLSLITIIGLIVGASIMKWSTAGQLLCNIPPSIIETFFMMILITGHTISDKRRRVDLQNMYSRRLKLESYITWCLDNASKKS